MNIEVLCEHPNNANTYIISSEQEAIVIDPANDIRSIKTLLKGKSVVAVLLTHGHYDHFITLERLVLEYDCLCYMHKNCYAKLKDVNLSCARYFGCNTPFYPMNEKVKFVSEGSNIKINDFNIKCYYKPGHTDCSVLYQIDNNLFTGDFIFQNGIGRCDLPTGNMVVMKRSLDEFKSFHKKGDLVIYPGHGESTTLMTELKTNYYLLKN